MSTGYDIAVIGAGAAGLMAAIAAAERGRRVRPPRKESPARRQDPDVRRHALQHHARHRQSRHRRPSYGPPRQIPALRSRGVLRGGHARFLSMPRASRPKSKRPGKIFPVSNRAIDVLDALLQRLTTQRRGTGARASRVRSISNRTKVVSRSLRPLRTLDAAT